MADSLMKLGFQVELLGLQDVLSQIKKMEKKGDLSFSLDRNFFRDLSKANQQIKGVFSKLNADALKAAYSPGRIRQFEEGYKRIQNSLEKSAIKQLKLQEEIQSKGLSERLKAQKEHELELEKDRMVALDRQFKKEFEKESKIMDRRKRALEEIDRSRFRRMAMGMEGLAEGANNIFENVKGGNVGGFAQMIKDFGKRREEQAQSLEDAGAARGGRSGALLGGLGKALKAIAPAIVAIGALVGTIALVGKVLLDADAQFKEFNQTLLEGETTVGDLRMGVRGMGEGLHELQDAFTDLSNNMDWGVLAKDHYQVINAFAQSGYTLKEMTGHLKTAEERMEALKNTTAAAFTYSKLLGMSTEETATHMADYMEDLGMTLEGVQSRFSSIFDAAKESGFATKRFFNMILQATSGMSMYNVRLEEAAGLLTRLGKILGVKVGGDFLQSLTKGFTDEGIQDRFKRVKTTGEGRTKRIIGISARYVADDFLAKLRESGKGHVLGGLGEGLTNSDHLVKTLAQMNSDQQGEILALMREEGLADLARQMENLMGLAKGTQGGASASAMALGSLDMGGKLAMQLNQVRAIIAKPIHEISSVEERAAFESITGTAGEEAEKLMRLSRGFESNFKRLQETAALVKDGFKLTEQERIKQADAFGFFVDEMGNIVAGRSDEGALVRTGKNISTIDEYIQGQGDALAEAMAPSVQEDIRIAQQIAANTSELSKVIQQGTEALLSEILYYVRDISAVFGKDLNENERRAQGKLLAKVDKEIAKTQALVSERRNAITELEASKAGKSSGEIAKIDKDIKAHEDSIHSLQQSLERQREMSRLIASDKDGSGLLAADKDEKAFVKYNAKRLAQSGLASEEERRASDNVRSKLSDQLWESIKNSKVIPEFMQAQVFQQQLAVVNDIADASLGKAMLRGTGIGGSSSPEEEARKAYESALSEDRQKMIEAEKRLHKNDLANVYARAMGVEWAKVLDQQDLNTAKDILSASGFEGSPKELEIAARALVRSKMQGGSPEVLKELLRARPERAKDLLGRMGDMGGFRSVVEHAAKQPTQNDFLMRLDGRTGAVRSIVKHSPQDQYLIGAKAGGPVSRAGGAASGGGTVVIENHFYNDAKGNYAQIKKVLSAVLGRQGLVGG